MWIVVSPPVCQAECLSHTFADLTLADSTNNIQTQEQSEQGGERERKRGIV